MCSAFVIQISSCDFGRKGAFILKGCVVNKLVNWANLDDGDHLSIPWWCDMQSIPRNACFLLIVGSLPLGCLPGTVVFWVLSHFCHRWAHLHNPRPPYHCPPTASSMPMTHKCIPLARCLLWPPIQVVFTLIFFSLNLFFKCIGGTLVTQNYISFRCMYAVLCVQNPKSLSITIYSLMLILDTSISTYPHKVHLSQHIHPWFAASSLFLSLGMATRVFNIFLTFLHYILYNFHYLVPESYTLKIS